MTTPVPEILTEMIIWAAFNPFMACIKKEVYNISSKIAGECPKKRTGISVWNSDHYGYKNQVHTVYHFSTVNGDQASIYKNLR